MRTPVLMALGAALLAASAVPGPAGARSPWRPPTPPAPLPAPPPAPYWSPEDLEAIRQHHIELNRRRAPAGFDRVDELEDRLDRLEDLLPSLGSPR